MSSDPRFERLPKWVQQRIRGGEERVRRLQEELDRVRRLLNEDVPEDTSVVVDPHSVNRRRLPVDQWTPIEFRYKPAGDDYWAYFHVTLSETNRLTVHGSSGLVLKPQSGNSVEILLEKR